MSFRNKTGFALAAIALLVLSACSSESETAVEETPAAQETTEATAEVNPCSPDALETLTAGTLTIATGEPAYYPWVLEDTPESGEGFEPAVAYAVAAELGYAPEEVTWVRTTFDGAIAPGPKTFDFNLQQYSITEERKQVVDFSSGYYYVTQAIVSAEGSAIAGATSIADLKSAKLGAAVGTTSLTAAETIIAPDAEISVFNDNAAAVQALKNGQVDGLVVDLPTAFYLSAVEIEGGVIVGQLPADPNTPEQFGLLLAKDSPLTDCVSQAVDTLRANGTLAEIEATWLAADQGAPVLQ
jgi:polar amino acid transport system substrate-binding protein